MLQDSQAKTKPRICYAGLNPNGYRVLIGNPNFDLVAVASVEYLNQLSWNPFDYLFALTYALRRSNYHCKIEKLLCALLVFVQPALSEYKRRWLPYLTCICLNRISVVDLASKPAALETLRSLECDLLVVNMWDLLSPDVLCCFRKGAINIHPSRLPEYRGALPTLWSIRNEDTASAVSFITISTEVDAGRILVQVPFDIEPSHTWRDIEAAIDKIVDEHIVAVILQYLSGQNTGTEQATEGQTATALYSAYQRIDLETESAREIVNKVSYYPYWDPGCYCYAMLRSIRVRVKNVTHVHVAASLKQDMPGSWWLSGICLYLQCRNGTLRARLYHDIPVCDSLRLAFRNLPMGDLIVRHLSGTDAERNKANAKGVE